MRSLLAKWCAIVGITVFAGVRLASAQDIGGPIKIIVPYPPGGGSDLVARLLADKLKDLLGQTVIVENKPGAGALVPNMPRTSRRTGAHGESARLFFCESFGSFKAAHDVKTISSPSPKLKSISSSSVPASLLSRM